MKLNFNFSGKTLLKDWWKIVRDNFTAIQTDHNELSDSVNTHKTAEVIDHPDKSVTSTKIADKAIHTEHIANYAITKDKVVNGAVTTDKIADKSITVNKLALDIVADLGKANTFLYSDGEPICLSEYKNTLGGYEVPDIPVNVFFKLENDTDSILTKFQTADDHYTTLSCDIAPGEVRICVLIQKEVSGADPQNGYLFVLDDNSIRQLLNDKAPTNHASGATTYGVGNASNYGHLKLSDSTTSTSSTSSGIAATPRAVKTAYDKVVDVDNKADNIAEDMATMQKELKAKISDINTELTTDNLFYDLSKYVNSDNTLVTDDSGVQYLSYSGSFENGAYLYHNFVVDNFRRKPKTETTLELTFDVASRHIAVDGCDSGGLNIGETDVLITYTDTTTETFGQSYYTATDTGDKTITINGTSETYKTTKFKIEIPVKKEIKSISFRIVSDNYYTNGDPTGNVCKQKTLIQSAVCYDDECVAVLRDDINANTSKITANTTKLTTEISDRQAADDELKAKFTDLKTVAFTGSYTDLSNKPTTATTSTSGFMSAADKTKLNGIATGANNYTHPSTHPASMIVQDSTHRFVSDNEISDWDNKLDANFVSNGYAGIDEVTTTLSDLWTERVAPPTTITIACSTSKHKNTADYHCNGTNDQAVINNAISSLPSTGGKIVLLEGTYNISGQINVNKPNVTICGMGNSTVLNCKQGIWGIAATQTNFTVANLKMTFDTYNGNGNSICIYASGSRCKFENLDLSNAVYGINCGGGYSIIRNVTATGNRTNIHLGSGHNVVSDCYSENAQETGVRIEGEYNIVANCYISDAEIYGVLLTGGGKNKVAGNVIKKDSYSDSQHSIRVTSSTYNSCSDNIMIGKNYTNAGGATNTFSNNKYS